MADRDKKKKQREAKKILNKHFDTVPLVLQTNPTTFYRHLVRDSLISSDAFDPDDRTMSKAQQATNLYNQCVTVVGITPSKFSTVVDILGEFPQLEEVVDEMIKDGEFFIHCFCVACHSM